MKQKFICQLYSSECLASQRFRRHDESVLEVYSNQNAVHNRVDMCPKVCRMSASISVPSWLRWRLYRRITGCSGRYGWSRACRTFFGYRQHLTHAGTELRCQQEPVPGISFPAVPHDDKIGFCSPAVLPSVACLRLTCKMVE